LMLGIQHFIENGWADGVDGAIICEPEENQVCVAQRGALRMKITVHGRMAHGAISWSGVNPNWRMAKIITALQNLEKAHQEKYGEHEFLKWPTITPTILQAPVSGDAQINVIPEKCMTTLDIRTIPGQNHLEIIQDIEEIFGKLKQEDHDFAASYEVIADRPATETAKGNPVVQAVYQAVESVLNEKPQYNGVP